MLYADDNLEEQFEMDFARKINRKYCLTVGAQTRSVDLPVQGTERPILALYAPRLDKGYPE